MISFSLLLHGLVFVIFVDRASTTVQKSDSSSSSSSSSSPLVFGVRRDGQQHLFLRTTQTEAEEKKVEKGDEELQDQKKDSDNLWAEAMSVDGPDSQNNTEVLAQVGGEVTFTCLTHHMSDHMVTWLRQDDDQLLTVGQQVYASEDRFTATHSHQNKAWQLWVKDVQLSDAGHYQCQLNTHPPVTFFFILKVTQAEAVVSGPSEVHIEEGSKLALECEVKGAASPPVYIFWYHNATMVNYGRHHYLQVQHQNYTSSLVVTQVKLSDAGIYTCEPHLATPANVTVHVVTGKTPAAMQHGRNHVEGGGGGPCPPASLSVVVVGILASSLIQPLLLHHYHKYYLLQSQSSPGYHLNV